MLRPRHDNNLGRPGRPTSPLTNATHVHVTLTSPASRTRPPASPVCPPAVLTLAPVEAGLVPPKVAMTAGAPCRHVVVPLFPALPFPHLVSPRRPGRRRTEFRAGFGGWPCVVRSCRVGLDDGLGVRCSGGAATHRSERSTDQRAEQQAGRSFIYSMRDRDPRCVRRRMKRRFQIRLLIYVDVCACHADGRQRGWLPGCGNVDCARRALSLPPSCCGPVCLCLLRWFIGRGWRVSERVVPGPWRRWDL